MGKKLVKKKKQTATAKEAAAEGSKRSAQLNKQRSEDAVFVLSTLSGARSSSEVRISVGEAC